MLNNYFRETMDRFEVQGKDLAEAFGCHHNYISRIRSNKLFPPSDRFWKLLETMDELAPGAKQYFAKLIANSSGDNFLKDIVDTVEPAKLLAAMSEEQVYEFILAIGFRLKKENQSKKE